MFSLILLAFACSASVEETANSHLADTSEDTHPEDTSDSLNVVLILVDTLRVDHLGLYGYARDTSPYIDAWSEDAVVFEQFFSQAGFTIPSISSLFTSLYPSTHGCCKIIVESDGPGRVDLSENVETIAEVFQSAGYRTAGLFKTGVFEREGMDQGFAHFEEIDGDSKRGESAAQLTSAAVEWLGEHAWEDSPFLLYLHYMDPHLPYQAPEGWYDRFDEGYDSDLTGANGDLKNAEMSENEQDIERLKALYDGEISYLDEQLKGLFEMLEEQGLNENTIVVLLGDHGEAFYEHGTMDHVELYQENIHVPLIIKAPGLQSGRLSSVVQTIDIAPTLAAMTQVEPSSIWAGRDLSAFIAGDVAAPSETYILVEFLQRAALISPTQFKYIESLTGTELYKLDEDPDESEDLSGSEGNEKEFLSDKLSEMLEAAKSLGEDLGI